MFYWKTTILPFIILSVASLYFPQVGSTVSWFFNHGKQLSLKLQRAAHQLADVICNKPEECKLTFDEFFEFLNDIPQELWNTVANFLLRNGTSSSTERTLNRDDETARKQRRAIIHAANYDKSEVIGNATKAEDLIKSLRFSSYEENNLCDLKEGIPGGEFDATVEEIAELTSMPVKLKRVVKRARNFTRGNVLAVNRLQFKTKEGNMVFGRIAVLRKGDTLDMAYSLHSVNYALKKKQRKPESAEDFTNFSETLNKAHDVEDEGDEDDDDDSNEISFDLRQDFLAFFHKQAIEGFVKHCDYLLKTLDNGEKEEPEILKHMAGNDGEKLEDVKGDGVK